MAPMPFYLISFEEGRGTVLVVLCRLDPFNYILNQFQSSNLAMTQFILVLKFFDETFCPSFNYFFKNCLWRLITN